MLRNDRCKQLKEAPHNILASFSALEFSEKVLHVLKDENSGALESQSQEL